MERRPDRNGHETKAVCSRRCNEKDSPRHFAQMRSESMRGALPTMDARVRTIRREGLRAGRETATKTLELHALMKILY